jgi:hypothetical protein
VQSFAPDPGKGASGGPDAGGMAMANGAVRVAVVTGGHSFDVVSFHQLFRELEMPGELYIQHIDDFCSSSQQLRKSYDVIVFYIMMMEGPSDTGLPWYAGHPKAVLDELGAVPQGIVVLHHAILAYPNWSRWNELVGITDRTFRYHMDQTPTCHVTLPDHPITRGLTDWTMNDETYEMTDAGSGNEILLTVEHAKSMRTIAWTRTYGHSRVFCYQSGHDRAAWAHPNFRTVLRRGILWSAHHLEEI